MNRKRIKTMDNLWMLTQHVTLIGGIQSRMPLIDEINSLAERLPLEKIDLLASIINLSYGAGRDDLIHEEES